MNRLKKYTKPKVQKIELDNSISLVMMTVGNPDPRDNPPGDKGTSKSQDPFSSPFDNNTFGN